jgi:hypothetical protein
MEIKGEKVEPQIAAGIRLIHSSNETFASRQKTGRSEDQLCQKS